MSAAQHFFIITSHLAYLPLLYQSATSKSKLAVVDTVFISVLIVVSILYHASDAGFRPFGNVDFMQQRDNFNVWSAILWIFVSSLPIGTTNAVAVFVGIASLFVNFPWLLIHTSVFQVAFLPAAILSVLAMSVLFQLPVPRYNYGALAAGIPIFSAGLPFLILEPYYTLHAIWHVLSGIGGYFARAGFRNESLGVRRLLMRIQNKEVHFHLL